MKKIKLMKILLPVIASVGLCAITVPTTMSLSMNSNLKDNAPTPISDLIQPGTIVGTFSATPTSNEIVTRLGKQFSTLKINQIVCTQVSTDTATINAESGSDIYSGTTNVIFDVKSTNSNSLLSFFGLSTTGQKYNVTTQKQWLPTSAPSQAQLFQEIADLTFEGTSINLNQIEIKSGSLTNWVAADDCYEVTVGPKSNTNFYDDVSDTVILQFNKQRNAITAGNTGNFTTVVSDLNGIPKDAADIQSSLSMANATKGWYADVFGDASTTWSWTTPNTTEPKFKISGNEKCTTKSGTLQQTDNVVALELHFKWVKLNEYVVCNTYSNNPLLNFDYKPDEWDIRQAIELQGGTGNAPLAMYWSEIEFGAFNYTTKKVTLTATTGAVDYTGSVEITFSYTN